MLCIELQNFWNSDSNQWPIGPSTPIKSQSRSRCRRPSIRADSPRDLAWKDLKGGSWVWDNSWDITLLVKTVPSHFSETFQYLCLWVPGGSTVWMGLPSLLKSPQKPPHRGHHFEESSDTGADWLLVCKPSLQLMQTVLIRSWQSSHSEV